MIDSILQQINVSDIQMRLVLITLIIMVNLILSVAEAIKLKNFSFKKLPNFIWEWMLCSASVVFIEVIISLLITSPIAQSVMIGVREIMLLSILGCYLKKIFESLKSFGWDVNIDKIINYIDDKKDNVQ